MSEAVLQRRPMTKKLREFFAESGKPVGPGKIPVNEDETPVDDSKGYYILYPLWASYHGPAYGDRHADVTWTYQLSCYSRNSDQLEWLRDKAIELLLDKDAGTWKHPLDVDGMSVMDRDIIEDSGGVTGTDIPSGIMSSDLRIDLTVTPIRGA